MVVCHLGHGGHGGRREGTSDEDERFERGHRH
jgi:hypothetical protein